MYATFPCFGDVRNACYVGRKCCDGVEEVLCLRFVDIGDVYDVGDDDKCGVS